MAHARVRAQQALVRIAKSGPQRMRGPVGRLTRRLRRDYTGPMVTVVVPVSDDETTRIAPFFAALRNQTHRNLDVLVLPYGRCDRVRETVRQEAAQDWRIRVRRRTASGLAAARNDGVRSARAELVLVAGAGDDLPLPAVERLVAAHEASGSPLVVGLMGEPDVIGWIADSPFAAAHRAEVRRTTLGASPIAVTDLGLGNKLFTRALWGRAGVGFTDRLASGADVALGLLRSADAFDLLTHVTYLPTGRRDGAAVGATPDVLSRLDGWIEVQEGTWREVEALGLPDVRDWWLWGVLDAAVQPLLASAERADERQWTTLRDHVRRWLDDAGPEVVASLSVESRVKLWLTRTDERAVLERFVTARLFAYGDHPTEIRDGRVWAQLPLPDDLDLPPELLELAPDETLLRAVVREVRWTGADQDRLELLVCAAIDNVHLDGFPQVACVLVGPDGARVDLPVEQVRDWRGNLAGRRHQDYSWGGVRATVDPSALVASPGAWQVELTMTAQGVTRTGIAVLAADHVAADRGDDHRFAPRPAGTAGTAGTVTLRVDPRATPATLVVAPDEQPRIAAGTLAVAGRTLAGTVSGAVVAVRATLDGAEARADVAADGTFALTFPAPVPGRRRWVLHALSADGREQAVSWPSGGDLWLGAGTGDLVATRGSAGRVEIWEAERVLAVDAVDLDDLTLTVRGRWLAATPPTGATVELVGPKVALTGTTTTAATAGADGLLTATFDLRHDPWGLGAGPIPHGRYRLVVRVPGQSEQRVFLAEATVERLHTFTPGTSYAVELLRVGRGFDVELTRPLEPGDRTPYVQTQLETWAREGDIPLEPGSVYFQVYGGSSATDSQLAIYHELRRVRPDATVYWGVLGAPARAPEGTVPVVVMSREYHRVMAAAADLCMNVDPPRWYDRRPGQRLLQTFHGYPAKSMGLRMWRAKHWPPSRIALEIERTSGEWDLILTPSPEMDVHYRDEYAYDGPIHSKGYPRDDILVSERADAVREDTRRRLGIQPGQVAVLYAPTWRDDMASAWGNAELVQHLDLESAARALGPEYVLLMRGHRFHAAGRSAEGAGARVLDVTDYPEINDLLLASDVAVLDYSSMRFDFALTGRPMIFLVPDLASYVGGVRGFLYDFPSSAPGPLVDTADEVVALLRDVPGLQARHAGEIEEFNARFNRWQDGHAAERVVAAFFE
ncbi:CDP-glycerol glycerophosphotransferase family protein [Pimelobacter sp. 30-1]|uniref:bifunctional glycosyltransferase/CDP-glycerol:glycerophosphate glycerophosphotransferase n=1 Tax=Pimelobacter sp. 30-1 TaxID=2004991 RepID=UPI001C049C8B|nr:CDP-glycerol glycerophosphotransferase family protein [Pimelobacter sp. 30-1]MBU2695096.1 hypothetical protein [Pimelobacter sp. 30-1]